MPEAVIVDAALWVPTADAAAHDEDERTAIYLSDDEGRPLPAEEHLENVLAFGRNPIVAFWASHALARFASFGVSMT